jgi:hypothetical protein
VSTRQLSISCVLLSCATLLIIWSKLTHLLAGAPRAIYREFIYRTLTIATLTWVSLRGILSLTEKAFHRLLLGAVDSTLSSLGESARQSVYFHLEEKFDITRDEIPGRIEDFDHGLERIFGVGTRFLEVLIMKKLYEEMGSRGKVLRLDQGKEFRFVDYVRAAQLAYLQTKKT